MKKLSLLLFVAAAFAVSCKNSKSTETQVKTAPEATANLSTNPQQEEGAVNTPETAVATTSNSGQKPALNPAHGEPYHRCDIQVGAPIDSPAPAQNTAPQVVQQQAPANSFNTNPISPSAAPAPSVSSTAAAGPKPALNPAHGEPHHRCDLQVGAPLI